MAGKSVLDLLNEQRGKFVPTTRKRGRKSGTLTAEVQERFNTFDAVNAAGAMVGAHFASIYGAENGKQLRAWLIYWSGKRDLAMIATVDGANENAVNVTAVRPIVKVPAEKVAKK